MKTPLLLKVLQIFATKANLNYKHTLSRKGDGGFTLLEVVVIVLILGILSAIAAPSWQAFITRQRVRTVNDRVLQSLRTAQSEAKRSKRDVTVTFYTSSSTPPADPPRVEIDTNPAEPDPSKKEIRKETFSSGGEIKPGTIVLATNATSITFDYRGNASATPFPFVVTVAPANSTNSAARQCAIVETIIGGMRTAEGEFNAATGKGCPVSP